jgi:hypothetical protein
MPGMLHPDPPKNGNLALQAAEKPSARKNVSRGFGKWLFWQHFLREEF